MNHLTLGLTVQALAKEGAHATKEPGVVTDVPININMAQETGQTSRDHQCILHISMAHQCTRILKTCSTLGHIPHKITSVMIKLIF